MLHENQRKICEAAYTINPLDVDVHAISKLEQALKIDPSKHDTLMCSGDVHTSYGFSTPEKEIARNSFDKAIECYKIAKGKDPNYEVFLKSLRVVSEAHLFQMQFHGHEIGSR
ncbi:hypothetical protein Sjap_015806 [Stephania japonica]|uniref:Uncharacterized protein n=1 Tax=Stephania japonica TaxID=461633 RepID=A0AAP0NSW1_9MAGN